MTDERNERPTAKHPFVTALGPVPGYDPGIGRYVAQLTETRAALLEAVEGLGPDQLAWHPDDETESIGTQLLHVAAIEWSWVFEEIRGRPATDYDGWEEALPLRLGLPQVSGQPLAYFIDRLSRVRNDAFTALRALTDADIGRLVPSASPSPGLEPGSEVYSIDWILIHLVHHEAHHAGQVELLRRFLPAGLAGTHDGR